MRVDLLNISKSFGGKTVLNIDKLSFYEGAITGIIGPNGSGKSTLMRIIAGLDREYKGTLQIDNRESDRELNKDRTLVFQKPYLINADVYSNIAYPLKIRGYSQAEVKRKSSEVIELLDLKEIRQQNAKTLSGGEMQKVALARAIVFQPRLLLLDEPTSNIDPQTLQLMERAIRYMNEEHAATVIIVTHNVRQLQRLCKEALYLRDGRAAGHGAVKEVLNSIQGAYYGELLEQELFT